jgi:glycosyltransferase involved in cell wall biosynthesis
MKAATALKIAVIVPCFNEATTIAKVVMDLKESLSQAKIYVFDNMSSDRTAEIARAAGAEVRSVGLQGKGNVVRRMFADVDADIYMMVDGDDTYDVSTAHELVEKLYFEKLDMVVGCRVAEEEAAYRFGHAWGNRMFNLFLEFLFGNPSRDVFSGYRVFSRRFAKSFPSLSSGFEIETELTVHALELRMPIADMNIVYRQRPEGSLSKLNTFRDGWRILQTMLKLFRIERPLSFYGILSGVFGLLSIALASPLILNYIETGLVPRFPTAVLAMGIMLVSVMSLLIGLILDNVAHGRIETKMLAYLSIAGIGVESGERLVLKESCAVLSGLKGG